MELNAALKIAMLNYYDYRADVNPFKVKCVFVILHPNLTYFSRVSSLLLTIRNLSLSKKKFKRNQSRLDTRHELIQIGGRESGEE